MITATNTLKEKYEAYKIANPKKRIREAAQELEVSEAALLMTGLGSTVTFLESDFEKILESVTSLGYVMALTRNEYCVNERKGVYENISFTPHAGLVLGADIDLRLFLRVWKYGFAVSENDRQSLQFFDVHGNAIHKIYLTDRSNVEAYEALVAKFRKAEQEAVVLEPAPEAAPVAELPDSEIDVAGFQEAWNKMGDSHEFFMLLRKFKVTRTQALRLAPAGRAKETTVEGFRKAMTACSEKQVPVMVFTSNSGCIQIHSGNITKLVDMGPWFNVLDPEFNLHLREDEVRSVWQVVKPSTDGDVNSIELFDKNGEMIVQFFGKRKPGIPELESWREVLKASL
ncbi:hemin-degrading factor [Pedobacter gandavensis]|uniref:hemin-degrading factor n=1 Tax=Pedobacter gandavensis TaxID=2679963 RepID=UPI0029305752|nr:ChuX/HutX family heme-like substrate-binding protein [Pedobacter gandavensis]